MLRSTFLTTLAAGIALGASTVAALAGPLMDRINAGETVRLGFANEVPWAYPGENNAPLGFVNAYVLGVLHEMGHDNIEPVVTDWGGLIPGLQASRFDLITGGMYILGSRCENVTFSEPMAKVSDAFIVKTGNPEGISTYTDFVAKNATMVTGAGFNTVEAALKEGVPEAQIMQVPGPTEILAAVKAGRAAAGAVTFFTAQELAKNSGGEIEVTDPGALPDWTQNWVGIGFRDEDADFVAAFNEAQAKYLGSPEMLAAVAEYGYDEKVLPGEESTEWVCANR
ncbi:transporter substrate-binding domain-containing protein [Albidovulum sediminicola]|uniref:Transporter substrate-binding domain-containing protein n=1 Tax=Albidovulum sediminicola TaxID=2984331 RepID=A0ABT2Z468_9RHOB|nr:transporter substrate-binding domain-containing protein [Defluviimonas sp. WL0075]MCV2865810.1 transporter substrate-binding domain-containing protein [Defluviimonas sp. WL0075]